MAEPGVAQGSGSAMLLHLKQGPHLIVNLPPTGHVFGASPYQIYLNNTIDPLWSRISWIARGPSNWFAPVRNMLMAGWA